MEISNGMKRILSAIVLLSLLTVLTVPLTATAQEGPTECCKLRVNIIWTRDIGTHECSEENPCIFQAGKVVAAAISTEEQCGEVVSVECSDDSAWDAPTGGKQIENCSAKEWGIICVMSTIYHVTNWIFIILMAVAVIFIIVGAFMFMTAGGVPERTTAARNYILYAVIALVIALLAKAIPAIVRFIIGV